LYRIVHKVKTLDHPWFSLSMKSSRIDSFLTLLCCIQCSRSLSNPLVTRTTFFTQFC
jgi:hypothetical protein